MKISLTIALTALVFVSGLSLPVTYLHEIGHAFVCSYYGFDYILDVNAVSGSLVCHGNPEPIVFRAAGGLFAILIVSFGIIPLHLLQRRWLIQGALIAVLTVIVGQALNAILETFANSWYINSGVLAYSVITSLSSIAFIALIYCLAREQYLVRVRA